MLLDTTAAAPARRTTAFDAFGDSVYRISALVRHNILIRLRDPGQMISYVVMPMVLMIVLKPLYVKAVASGTTQVVTGLLVMFSVFAIAIAGSTIMVERHWQTWDRLRATPVLRDLLGKLSTLLMAVNADGVELDRLVRPQERAQLGQLPSAERSPVASVEDEHDRAFPTRL